MKKLYYILIILLIVSCSPQTKEDYLLDYNDFIKEATTNYKKYSDKDWELKDEEFKKYSSEWREQFKDEFTWKESLILTKYEFQYQLLKVKRDSKGIFKEFDELKKQLQYYKENEMEDDMKFLIEQAKDLEGTAKETVEEIFKELDIEYTK